MPKTKQWRRDYSDALKFVMSLPFSTTSKSRFRDNQRELRIRLQATCRIHKWHGQQWPGGETFFHEASDKANQFLAATLSGDGKTVDVTLFLDKLMAELGLEPIGNICRDSGNTKKRSGARKR